jgi:hypothetical protein
VGSTLAIACANLAPNDFWSGYHESNAHPSAFIRSAPVILLLGLAAIGWAGYSLLTGKGYYKGCPPGGYDRTADPFSFWATTIIILAIGIFAVLISLGVISLLHRPG